MLDMLFVIHQAFGHVATVVHHGWACSSAGFFGLEDLVLAANASVIVGGFLPSGWLGAFHRPTRTVTMRNGLTAAEFRSVLAHELGHAFFDHDGYAHAESRQERMADRFAAKRLIQPDDFARACELHCGDVAAVARELDVMPWVVREYATTLTGRMIMEECAVDPAFSRIAT